MKRAFFIQRAAIDVLLLNKATAIDICVYLVISKYSDRHGYYSGVGYKTIKERLGIGQKKVDESIKHLYSMKFEGQKLLYSMDEWLFEKTGTLAAGKNNVGWVLGWIESEYKHRVWLFSDLVGNNGDKDRPLNYFVTVSERDNHARLLLLLYKYHNKQYSGVNYRFASLRSQKDPNYYTINDLIFYKSYLGDYHISQNILEKLGLSKTREESSTILNDLRNNGFLNVSISVIGKDDDSDSTIYENIIDDQSKSRPDRTVEQIEAFDTIREYLGKKSKLRQTFVLELKREENAKKKGTKPISICLKRILTGEQNKRRTDNTFKMLMTYPDHTPNLYSIFLYRLDYKSNKKKSLKLDECIAGKVENFTRRSGLEPASRAGKFYKTYWWFNPGISEIDLVGILVPTHIPVSQISVFDKTQKALDWMANVADHELNIKPDHIDECPF